MESIRQRAKERNEQKARERLERFKARQADNKENAGGDRLENQQKSTKNNAVKVEADEESGSDEEGWCGGLFMFTGNLHDFTTPQVN